MKFKDTKYGDLTGSTYDGNIDVDNMKLTSLEGSPKVVNGYFDCNRNDLVTLEGAPETVNSFFRCSENKLTSLKGGPKVVNGTYSCSDNIKLISLKYSPVSANSYFDCTGTGITSLEGSPKKANSFYCDNCNNLSSLAGIPSTINKNFSARDKNKLTQEDMYALLVSDIKGKIEVPDALQVPTKKDYILYNKLNNMKKFLKIKALKDKLK